VDRGERAAADHTLATRASEVTKAAVASGSLPTDGTYAVRLVTGDRVSAQKGATTQFSIPVAGGYSTVTAADGSHWRSLAQTLKSGAQLQILIDLSDVEQRHSGNVRTVNIAVLLAALIAAAGVRLVAEFAHRRGAGPAEPDSPAGDLPDGDLPDPGLPGPDLPDPGLPGPDLPDPGLPGGDLPQAAGDAAVADSAGSPGADELAVVRLFREPVAAVGTGLETLLDNPEMSSTQRHLVLAAVQTEHRRLLELLDTLEKPERHA
jgi:hypothetical protein